MLSDQSGGSQSSGGRQKQPKQPKSHTIPFTVHRDCLDANTGLGNINLQMPSNLEPTLPNLRHYPPLVFDMKDEDQKHCLTMMKIISHQNVLQLYAMDQGEKETYVKAYVEHYTGDLSYILGQPHIAVNHSTSLVPSVSFRDIVSAIVDGIDYIRESGYYHGNFSWHTTFHYTDKTSMTVKLANFESKGSKALPECQVDDWFSLGVSLQEVSQKLKDHSFDESTCCLIDDLAQNLRSVTVQSLSTIKKDVKDHVFFWDERRRKSFFSTEVPEAWNKQSFVDSFSNSPSKPNSPWNTYDYCGYMYRMVKYRAEHKIQKYKFDQWRDFLQFISGMYTHEGEFKGMTITVDIVVQTSHKRLCLDVKAAME